MHNNGTNYGDQKANDHETGQLSKE